MIEVQIDSREVTAALERLAGTGGDLRAVFQEAGELLVQSTRRRFRDKEGPDGTPWPGNAAYWPELDAGSRLASACLVGFGLSAFCMSSFLNP
ncbi:phage virion morphogenesis protein [Ectothiorhodospira mobilis]|uniref:phage virion morphogenesis protein n=1 Tax=Ectothiorhodospira mobilis TaxID=195064 RepID=UPI0019059540